MYLLNSPPPCYDVDLQCKDLSSRGDFYMKRMGIIKPLKETNLGVVGALFGL